MTNLTNSNNLNFDKNTQNNAQSMTPNSNYFKGRFIKRTRQGMTRK